MDHDLVAGLPAGHARADLPDHPRGVGAADVVVLLGVVAEHGDGLAERGPDVVEVHPGGHHAHDHLERAGLGDLDLLDLEGVRRFAKPLLADHPCGHRAAEARPARSRRVRLGSGQLPLVLHLPRSARLAAGCRRGSRRMLPGCSQRVGPIRTRCVRQTRLISDEASSRASSPASVAACACAGTATGAATRGRISVQATTAPHSVTIEPTSRPVPSAETNASLAAATMRSETWPPIAAPLPSALVIAARVDAGTWGRLESIFERADRGHERAHDGDAEGAADHPAHREDARRRAGLAAVDRVHRGGAHRRHHQAHAEAHQHEARQQQAVAAVDGQAGLDEQSRGDDREPDRHQRARADAVGQAAGERGRDR